MQLKHSVLLLQALPAAYAWSALGHEAVAYIAQNLVSSATKTYLQTVLGDTSTSYLATISTWADTYRSTTAGAFSKPYHYIDAQDSPPSSCGVSYSRDCGTGGCVVSAITNYTTLQITNADAVSLKMLVHFIGDIHQPLHDENLDSGGNGISVTFSGSSTNLHTVWDGTMLNKIAGGSTITYAKSYATTLTTMINTGSYASVKASWLTGINLGNPQSTAMVWASDANTYVCSNVLAPGLTYLESTDLSGTYYTGNVDCLNLLIAKAGYRLAAWLNLIATGTTGL